MPSTVYSLGARLRLEETYARRVVAELEREGVICRCSNVWGRHWWRLADRPEPAVPPLGGE